jgi:hypothetical protein
VTIQSISGRGLLFPEMVDRFVNSSYLLAFSNIGPIDATAEKISMVGRVFMVTGGANKNLSKIHFRFGSAITKSNGSTLRISVQDVSTTSADADGTADQSYTIANADAGFAADTVYTATLGSTRSVAKGDKIAIVWDYDGGFQAGDSVTIAGISQPAFSSTLAQCYARLYTSSWALTSVHPNLVLEFDDGTFGTLEGAGIFSNIGTLTYNNTSDPDEYALKFQLPFPLSIDALWARIDADGDCTLVLTYGGSTVSIAIDKDNRASVFGFVFIAPLPSHISLAKDTDYYLSIRPDSATSISIQYLDVAASAHWQAWDGGSNFRFTSRVDAGAWAAETTTRRILAGIRAIGFDDGAGDFPDAANVIEGDTTNGAAGTYHEAAIAEVQDGVFFGPASAYEGTYAGGGGGAGRPEIRGGNL